ncbi:MAG: response regulator [Rhodocyclales bacterium]|nr:response regulator [Rhodocyclales bacterium]
MFIELDETTAQSRHKALVVDDDPTLRMSMEMTLSEDFEVVGLESGEECLAELDTQTPDLICLDIEMDGMDGHQTCRALRALGLRLPVIFVSSHDSLEERIKAFDAGGDDFMVKPFDPALLHLKANALVRLHQEREKLEQERKSAQDMAFGFLKTAGETGVLLEFLQKSIACTDYQALGLQVLHTAAQYDLQVHLQIRHPEGTLNLTPKGPASPLEVSILEKSADLGRLFRFGQRLAVNYPSVTLLVQNLPEDEEVVGRIRDNLALLAESAHGIASTITIRHQAHAQAHAIQAAASQTAATVEALRSLYQQQQVETRLRLDQLIHGVESTYVFLGLSENQEGILSEALRSGADEVLTLFRLGEIFEARLQSILTTLRK